MGTLGDPAIQERSDAARTSGYHLLEVIFNRILDFSKLDQTPRGDDICEFDLRAVGWFAAARWRSGSTRRWPTRCRITC